MASFSTLRDDFNDNSIDLTIWQSIPDGVTESGGQLNIDSPTGTSRLFKTSAVYDFTDGEVQIEITAISIPTSRSLTVSPLNLSNNGFIIRNGNIYGQYLEPSVGWQYTVQQIFNSTTHRHLRMIHSSASNTIVFEYSSDSVTWSTLGTVNTSGSMNWDFRTYIFNSSGSLATMSIDNLNNQPRYITSASYTESSSSVISETTYHIFGTSSTNSTSEVYTGLVLQSQEIELSYLIKIYDSSSSYIGILTDALNELEYYQRINDSGSSVQYKLGRSARNYVETRENLQAEDGTTLETENNRPLEAVYNQFKTVGEGTDVDLNLRYDIYVYKGSVEAIETEDGELLETEDGRPIEATLGSPDGKRIFSGWVSKYRAHYGREEYVVVDLLHHSTELDNYVVNDGTNTTFSLNSYDPSNMLKYILDQYALDGGTLTYTENTVELTGSVASYDFKMMTVKEAIDKILELSPSDWYWYIDQGTNEVHFHEKADTPAHTFVFGYHIQEIDVERHLEDLVNEVRFVGGGDPQLYKLYEDATSKTTWRRGLEILTDSRVTTATSAQILSEALIERYKDPVYSTEVTILEKRYRTETIKLGDTVSFGNFGNFIDNLNLMVVGISYSKNSVTLQLGTILPKVNKRLEEVKRNLRREESQNVTDAPV